MVFGAAVKGMHKSAVAAGQSREQEGRPGEKSSRSEGEKDEFVGSEKRNSLGRRSRRRLRRSLSPLSPFRFYDRRRDPRSLPPSVARPPLLTGSPLSSSLPNGDPSSLPPSLCQPRADGRSNQSSDPPPSAMHFDARLRARGHSYNIK